MSISPDIQYYSVILDQISALQMRSCTPAWLRCRSSEGGVEHIGPNVPYIKWLLAFMPRRFLRWRQRLTSVNGSFFGLQKK